MGFWLVYDIGPCVAWPQSPHSALYSSLVCHTANMPYPIHYGRPVKTELVVYLSYISCRTVLTWCVLTLFSLVFLTLFSHMSISNTQVQGLPPRCKQRKPRKLSYKKCHFCRDRKVKSRVCVVHLSDSSAGIIAKKSSACGTEAHGRTNVNDVQRKDCLVRSLVTRLKSIFQIHQSLLAHHLLQIIVSVRRLIFHRCARNRNVRCFRSAVLSVCTTNPGPLTKRQLQVHN